MDLSPAKRPNIKTKSPVKEPVSALRTPEGRNKTESPSEYRTRVLSKERHRPYDLIRDLLGKVGSRIDQQKPKWGVRMGIGFASPDAKFTHKSTPGTFVKR